jgi:molecular chaperone GrpE
VLTVVRTGYALNGRLLRPASVIVSSGAAKGAAK